MHHFRPQFLSGLSTGAIPYNMTNDYMFRVILQENESVLRGLVGSLLHLEQSEIQSVLVTNPIKPGEQIDSKTFVLDINVLLNDEYQKSSYFQ